MPTTPPRQLDLSQAKTPAQQPRASIRDELVAVGRKQVLDLREALALPAQPEPVVAPKPQQPVRTVQGVPTNKVTDVYKYGLAMHVPELAAEAALAQPDSVAPAVPATARVAMPLRRRIVVIGQYPVIAAAAIGAAYSSSIGQWFVLAYGIYALVRRLDSRYSFGAAIFLLVTVPLFQGIGQSGIAQNAAIYVFELLVIGTVQALIELRQSGEVTD